MQLGFNTNFRYRDVVFHVQTEDSGRANPHVITHLFHGGSIIASVKSDYAHLLGEADLEGAVRTLMEGQHKSMLKQLSRGEFDPAIRERLGPEIFAADRSAADTTGGATDDGPGGGSTDRSNEVPAAGGTAARRRAGSPLDRAASATRPAASAASAARSAPATRAASAARPTPGAAPAGGGAPRAVAEPTVVGSGRSESTSGLARVFGERVVSEKPLDEVVLEYLVENARKRKRPPKS